MLIRPPLLAVQAAVAPSAFERTVGVLADVATIVIALALIVTGAVAIWAALRVRKAVASVKGDLAPVRKHLESALANVEYVSQAVRQDVDAVSRTVRGTTEKVERATETAALRLGELNALLDVVQSEAETAFVRTAAAVRGVHAGAESLARGRTPAAGDEMDELPRRPRRRTILDD